MVAVAVGRGFVHLVSGLEAFAQLSVARGAVGVLHPLTQVSFGAFGARPVVAGLREEPGGGSGLVVEVVVVLRVVDCVGVFDLRRLALLGAPEVL